MNNPNIPKALYSGILKIGDSEIQAYVLENGERILSTRGVMSALGRRWRGRKYPGTQLPVFLEAKNLKPYINNELYAVLSPIQFKTDRGAISEGFKAEILPKICDVFLSARKNKSLLSIQYNTAAQAEILIRGLATVGIIALVDEATGYQEVNLFPFRDRCLDACVEEYSLLANSS